jgi:hypothetical protein
MFLDLLDLDLFLGSLLALMWIFFYLLRFFMFCFKLLIVLKDMF